MRDGDQGGSEYSEEQITGVKRSAVLLILTMAGGFYFLFTGENTVALVLFGIAIVITVISTAIHGDVPLGVAFNLSDAQSEFEAGKQGAYESSQEIHNESNQDSQSGETSQTLEQTTNRTITDIHNPNLRTKVQDKIDEGWEIEEVINEEQKVVMHTAKGGTVGGHALLGVFSLTHLGLGNVVYQKASKHRNKERIVVRANNSQAEPSESSKQLLEQLNNMHDDGLITDLEYENKRKEIIERI